MAITDLLREEALPKLTSLAETIFRRDRKLSSNEDLSEQGYGFSGGRFRLNDNFGIGERDLVFLFNTYEIGAGAMPPTEIAINLSLLRDVLKPDVHIEQRLWK